MIQIKANLYFVDKMYNQFDKPNHFVFNTADFIKELLRWINCFEWNCQRARPLIILCSQVTKVGTISMIYVWNQFTTTSQTDINLYVLNTKYMKYKGDVITFSTNFSIIIFDTKFGYTNKFFLVHLQHQDKTGKFHY